MANWNAVHVLIVIAGVNWCAKTVRLALYVVVHVFDACEVAVPCCLLAEGLAL